MSQRTIALALLVVVFLVGAVWVALQQNTTRLALAPEISAVKTERSSGVLSFQDKKPLNLGSTADFGDYTVKISTKKEIQLNVCVDPGQDTCEVTQAKKAYDYTLLFDLSRLNADDVKLSQFISDRLGSNFLVLVDPAGKEYPMQDLGGMPEKNVRFFAESIDASYTLDFRSAEMQKQNQTPVSWKTE